MKPSKSVLRSLERNKRLRLREGVLNHLKDREWSFNRLENGRIFLVHESGAFGIGVNVDDIEWADLSL
jgi:hypothetical protein